MVIAAYILGWIIGSFVLAIAIGKWFKYLNGASDAD